MTNDKRIKSLWIENIKTLLCSLGFSGIWCSQSFLNKKWLVKAAQNKLNDLFIQRWLENIRLTSNSNFYKIFKTTFQQSNYFSHLSTYYCKTFIRFRTRNHRFPVETGRWRSIPFDERKCHLCEMDIGDEFHYLLVCSYFTQERQKYLKPYYYTRPNTLKLEQLINTKNVKSLRNLCKFIDIIQKMPLLHNSVYETLLRTGTYVSTCVSTQACTCTHARMYICIHSHQNILIVDRLYRIALIFNILNCI